MGKSKVLVKVHPEGKYVVDIDKEIDIAELTPGEGMHAGMDTRQSSWRQQQQQQPVLGGVMVAGRMQAAVEAFPQTTGST